MAKVRIVLDADVLIHFSKGGMLSLLPDILPEYEHVILSTVYEEIHSIRNQVDNQVRFLKNITLEQFNPTGDMLKEYALLLKNFGKGESACMAYCKFTHHVIGSSNLKDIKEYCCRTYPPLKSPTRKLKLTHWFLPRNVPSLYPR